MSDPSINVHRGESVTAAFARWRANLSNTNVRNPLLALWLDEALTLTPTDAAALFARLAQSRKSVPLTATGASVAVKGGPDALTVPDLDADALWQALARLHRHAQMALTERGVHLLHVVGGVLEWTDPETSEALRTPLLLLPVELTRPTAKQPATLTATGTPFLNPVLQARLVAALDLRLPQVPASANEQTLSGFFADVRHAIAGLPDWRLEPMALLTLLPTDVELLERDGQNHEALLCAHSLVRVLLGVETADTLTPTPLPEVDELDAIAEPPLHILDADAHQRLALVAAARGHSFILQTPPGTAQVQAIANLAAARLGHGKTVLVVSPRPAHLETLARLLREAGLSDFVLDLSTAKIDSRAVVTELQRCLERPPVPAAALNAQEVEQLRQYRDHLNGYANALHQQREPLQRSVWWALGEVARCHAAPRLSLGDFNALEISANWLNEAHHAVERAQHFWHLLEQGDNGLWWGFKSNERYSQKLREELLQVIDKVRSRLERLQTVADNYATAIGANGPLPWLLRASELLETSPHPPAAWLQDADPAALARDLERCAAAYQQGGQARQPLTERYGPALWRLPEGTSQRVDQAWHAAAPLLAAGDTRGTGLLQHQQKLRGWAADTLKRLPHWLTDVRTLEKWLTVPLPMGAPDATASDGKHDPAPQALRQLLRLANLCMSETPPERNWVTDPAALTAAQQLIASLGPVFADNHRRRNELLTRYTENLFELDVIYLAERFRGSYASWLRFFNLHYRRDRRAIQRRSKDEILPRTMHADMLVAGDLVTQRQQLDAERPARQAVLGRYEKGMATDFEAADKATRVAAEALELAVELGCATLPDKLIEALSSITPAPEKIRAAAKRLHDSLGPWLHTTEELKAVLPSEKLPSTGAALLDSALSAVEHYAKELQTTLNHFAALTDPVLANAPTPPPDAVALVADLQQAELLQGAEQLQPADAARWSARFGAAFQGAHTDWAALRKQITWVGRVRELFGTATPSAAYVQLATASGAKPPSSQDLKQAKEQVEHALHSLELRFEAPAPRHGGKRLAEVPPEELRQQLATYRERIGELAEWIEWRQLADRFAHLGLAAFWQALQQERPARAQLAECLQHSVLHRWLEMVFAQEPALGKFERKEHERIALEFRALDRKLQNAVPAVVASQADRARAELAKHETEVAVLRREAAKQDGLPALAALLDEVPRLRAALKPCVLATPLTAAQWLHPQQSVFDIVVVDEAHHLTLTEALPALARGRQVVVGGDPQLPTETPPSFLDACHGKLKVLPLRWQEPSRPLTVFANAHFYGRFLRALPSAGTPASPVSLQRVEGAVYEEVSGSNPREAQTAVEVLLQQCQEMGDKKSVGLVGFDVSHQEALAAELERCWQKQPELEALAKNVLVGGTPECDLLILSVGYGRDAAGQLSTDFGPLNQEGGARWINADTLSARVKLLVVSSLEAKDLDALKNPTEGVRVLADLLSFASSGHLRGESPNRHAAEFGLQQDLAAEVQKLPYHATVVDDAAAFGGDLIISDPETGRRLLLVLCDGVGYHDLATVSDRERLLPEALEKLGWRLHRIWGPDWWRRRAEEVERLKQALEASRKPLAPPPPAAKPVASSAGQGQGKRLDQKRRR